MKHAINFVFLASMLPSEFAVAETYRCIMNHEISVGANSSFDDNKEANKGQEFFIAIDNKTQKGTFSTCTESGCGANGYDVDVILRYEADERSPRRGLRFIVERYQLWSLDGRKDTSDFVATSVWASERKSSTSFGSCRLIIR
jgi:hypothetical protein